MTPSHINFWLNPQKSHCINSCWASTDSTTPSCAYRSRRIDIELVELTLRSGCCHSNKDIVSRINYHTSLNNFPSSTWVNVGPNNWTIPWVKYYESCWGYIKSAYNFRKIFRKNYGCKWRSSIRELLSPSIDSSIIN
jgi:hypothetical protein